MINDYLGKQRQICEAVKRQLKTPIAIRKFCPLEDILNQIESKRPSETVVSSSGTFLLPHYGHCAYFEQSSDYGDIHVVCLNTDESILRLGRYPDFVPLDGRVIFIAGHESVDYVTLFDEDNPAEILSHLKPDVHTKGIEWLDREMPERTVVQSYGGRIELIPLTYDISSSILVDNIKKSFG